MLIELFTWIVSLKLWIRNIIVKQSHCNIFVKLLIPKSAQSFALLRFIVRMLKELKLKFMANFTWFFFLKNS
jgi:hypothetical protein